MKAHFFTVFRQLLKKRAMGLPEIGYTRDISVGGIYFYTRLKLKRGSCIFLTIHLTSDGTEGGTPPRLQGTGQVLRVDETRNVLPFADLNGVAVKFSEELAVSF